MDDALSRRELLGLAAAASVPLVSRGLLRPDRALAASSPIVKPLPPEWFIDYGSNAEMRWDAMRGEGDLVPAERFFVRNHTVTPLIDARSWRLRVFGDAVRGRSFGLQELRRLPSRTVTAAIECAGNGRSFFGTQQGTPAVGTQWRLGAIGVARWRGVPLCEVLERAGLHRDAVDVMPAGLDATVVTDGVDHGHVRRPLPIGKALDDVLLVYEMNGEPLPPDHGFPVRLLVPGWVGVANVKWVGSLEVSRSRLESPWNTTWYRGLTVQPVKSALELPFGARLASGRRTVLIGRSWSGRAAIHHVDVSVDGGATWRRAEPTSRSRRHGWLRWELPWTPRRPGETAILARATDFDGTTQPASVPFNDNGYLFWATVRHPVTVT
jgi:DMSO/TMAO reductase YedYZ molybdopterin-dependent catalytic subunit